VRAALERDQHTVVEAPATGEFRVVLSLEPGKLPPQAFTVTPNRSVLTIVGGDGRGLIYGAFAVAEQLDNHTTLKGAVMSGRRPAIKGDIWSGDGLGCGHVSGL
jgi:hypothetical protein